MFSMPKLALFVVISLACLLMIPGMVGESEAVTIVIGPNGENCGVIGAFQTGLQWDQATKTCTLTQDLDFSSSPLRNPSPGPSADGFILDFGGITLDGAGHKIIGEPGESYNYPEVGIGNAGVL